MNRETTMALVDELREEAGDCAQGAARFDMGPLLARAADEIERLTLCFSDASNRECRWLTVDEDEDTDPLKAWNLESSCGEEWRDCGEGDPPGRWVKFCPFCGGKAVFAHPEAK